MVALSFFARLLVGRWAVPIITVIPLVAELWMK